MLPSLIPRGYVLDYPGIPCGCLCHLQGSKPKNLAWFCMMYCLKKSISLRTGLLRTVTNNKIWNSLSTAHAQTSFCAEDLVDSKLSWPKPQPNFRSLQHDRQKTGCNTFLQNIQNYGLLLQPQPSSRRMSMELALVSKGETLCSTRICTLTAPPKHRLVEMLDEIITRGS